MRIFIAFPVVETVKSELARLQGELQKHLRAVPVRWTEPEQFHVTLEFLGELSERNVQKVKEVVARHVGAFGPMRYILQKVAAFPHPNAAQVLIVQAVEVDSTHGTVLRQALHDEFNLLGLTQDFKPWKPHLTLGRVKGEKRPRLESAADIAVSPVEWVVNRVEIVESELTSKGSRYTVLDTYSL